MALANWVWVDFLMQLTLVVQPLVVLLIKYHTKKKQTEKKCYVLDLNIEFIFSSCQVIRIGKTSNTKKKSNTPRHKGVIYLTKLTLDQNSFAWVYR